MLKRAASAMFVHLAKLKINELVDLYFEAVAKMELYADMPDSVGYVTAKATADLYGEMIEALLKIVEGGEGEDG